MKVSVAVKGRFHAFRLAHQLEKRGFLQQLITTFPAYDAVKYGISRKNITSLVWQEMAVRAWSKMPRTIQRHHDLVLFFHQWFDHAVKRRLSLESDIFVGWSGASLAAIRFAKQQGIKTVLERGSTHIHYQNKILQDEYRLLNLPVPVVVHPEILRREQEEYRTADYISVPSSFVKKTFIEQGISADKILVTPYGADLEWYHPLPKNDNLFRIIFCGNCCIRKGAVYLLKAFHELNLPDAELWFIGRCADEMRPFVEKYASPQISFKGSFEERDLAYYYSQGSVFCLPSVEEGLSMVLLQAMACGLPVIATPNTGIEDVIEDGKEGFVTPLHDMEALKDKILFCYNNQSRCAEMGQAALNRVSEGFSWDDYGAKMVKHYERILSS